MSCRCPLYPRKRTSLDAMRNVRFVPKADVSNRSKAGSYSITSSAVASSDDGTVRPRMRAVTTLMTSSNLVACTTGKSAGFSPLRMRPM